MGARREDQAVKGVWADQPRLGFVVDGRAEGSGQWTLDEHGFALLSGRASVVRREAFLEHPQGNLDGPLGEYHQEVVDMARSLVPSAEEVRVMYHFVRRASAGPPAGREAQGAPPKIAESRAHQVPPKDPMSKAHQVVSGMILNLNYASFFPADYLDGMARQLHLEGAAGEEAFLRESVASQALPLDANKYALMPAASAELQEEVLALLRDDADYAYIATARQAVPKPAAGAGTEQRRGASAEMLSAAMGVHTDVSAKGWEAQFRQLCPLTSGLGSVAAGSKRRVMLLKFWRGINPDTPIVNHHLALLDKRTVGSDELEEIEIDFKGMLIKQYRLSNGTTEGHRWVYFIGMQHDEVICFVQGDLTLRSAGPAEITFPRERQDHATFHTAFEDPGAPQGVPPRESVEVAVCVFFPEEADSDGKQL